MEHNQKKKLIKEQTENIFTAQGWVAGRLCGDGTRAFSKDIKEIFVSFNGMRILVLSGNKYSIWFLISRAHKEFSLMLRSIFPEAGMPKILRMGQSPEHGLNFDAKFQDLDNLEESIIGIIRDMEQWANELDFLGELKKYHKTEWMSQWHITALAWLGDFVPLLEYQQDIKKGRTLRFEKADISLEDIDRAIDIALERSEGV